MTIFSFLTTEAHNMIIFYQIGKKLSKKQGNFEDKIDNICHPVKTYQDLCLEVLLLYKRFHHFNLISGRDFVSVAMGTAPKSMVPSIIS